MLHNNFFPVRSVKGTDSRGLVAVLQQAMFARAFGLKDKLTEPWGQVPGPLKSPVLLQDEPKRQEPWFWFCRNPWKCRLFGGRFAFWIPNLAEML